MHTDPWLRPRTSPASRQRPLRRSSSRLPLTPPIHFTLPIHTPRSRGGGGWFFVWSFVVLFLSCRVLCGVVRVVCLCVACFSSHLPPMAIAQVLFTPRTLSVHTSWSGSIHTCDSGQRCHGHALGARHDSHLTSYLLDCWDSPGVHNGHSPPAHLPFTPVFLKIAPRRPRR